MQTILLVALIGLLMIGASASAQTLNGWFTQNVESMYRLFLQGRTGEPSGVVVWSRVWFRLCNGIDGFHYEGLTIRVETS